MLFFWNALSFLAWDPLEYKDHGYIAPYVHKSKCVDTQADCVDTTGFNCSDCFLGQSSSVDTQVDCVDTTSEGYLSTDEGYLSTATGDSTLSVFWKHEPYRQ
ncbi:hypothetical protein Taro_050404, partial [Colocasia esculenta]|nr:hypothetical protein [Colocasia esculenta]